MDYEKAYKKAVEKLRYKISDNDGNIDYNEVVNVDELQDIFHELAESEGERIRKALIAFIKKRDRSGCDYDYDKWIAWLEKQAPKLKWTEEDERHENTIIRAIHGAGNITPIDGELAEKWLKSLKQRIVQ